MVHQVRTFRAPRLLLVLLLLLCLLPFVNKAVHIDDPLFIWTAKHIQGHPLDFFGFSVNWYGIDQPISIITKNPPLYSYFLAASAMFIGWDEPAMHITSFLMVLALALGTYQLALQLRAEPFMATLFTICTPVVLLSGTTIMCDVTMTACWVWSVYLWLYGLEAKKSFLALAGSVILVIMAGFAKYFGMALLPLLVLYAAYKRPPSKIWFLFMLLPLAFFAFYQWWTSYAYGTGLISEAARYSLNVKGLSFAGLGENLLIGLSFAGGCLLTPLFLSPLLLRTRGWVIVSCFLVGILAILLQMGTLAGLKLTDSWLSTLQVVLFMLAGGGLLVLAIADLISHRSAESLLMALWVLGTFIFAAVLNWTVSGRNMLPLAPVAGILLSRRLYPFDGISKGGYWGKIAFLIPLLLVSLLITAADYRWAAETKKAAVISAAARSNGSDLWFQGHWGFQYYMELLGCKPIDFTKSRPRCGDIIVTPTFGTNIKVINDNLLNRVKSIQTTPLSWLSTMNLRTGAGFYSAQAGPLPFSFGKVVPDQYTVATYLPAGVSSSGNGESFTCK